jgi:deaminated glutathione amidase
MTEPLTIAALQTVATPDVARNLASAGRLVAQAAQGGARLVALPEYFCFMGQRDEDKLALAETPGAGPIQDWLRDTARRHGVWIVGGTLPLRVAGDEQRASNACCVASPEGVLAARYDKVHLFHYDNGRERYDESRVLARGQAPVAFDAAGWRVGLSVCYDLRFPELYRRLMQPPCDLIAVPAAFTHTTGQAHWEILLRARAIENQCYVLAPAQGGVHENGRRTWGHSLIVDPWGVVLGCRKDDGEGMVLAQLDRQRLRQVRQQLPALQHRVL